MSPDTVEVEDKSSSTDIMEIDSGETAYGIGAGYSIEVDEDIDLTLGANFDIVDLTGDMEAPVVMDFDGDSTVDTMDYEQGADANGTSYGIQSILKYSDTVTLGLRYSNTNLEGSPSREISGTLSSMGPYSSETEFDRTIEGSEMGARVFVDCPKTALTGGIEYFSSVEETENEDTTGSAEGEQTEYVKEEQSDIGIGIAYKFLEDKLLAGLEVHSNTLIEEEGQDTDDDDIIDTIPEVETTGLEYSLGIEYSFMENACGRLSYGINNLVQKQDGADDIKTTINTIGLGIGYMKPDKGKLDLYYMIQTSEDDQPVKVEEPANIFGITATLYFG
jgi:opacity protein-like surface antigen